ncbi:hypothetical protein, partial [Candidatus Amarolinea dominans]|uniref:hypothetical protein n=1 Tax=Candidatus Amarolinea dominans TaxID=3140696 RepID=UPI0031CC86FD
WGRSWKSLVFKTATPGHAGRAGGAKQELEQEDPSGRIRQVEQIKADAIRASADGLSSAACLHAQPQRRWRSTMMRYLLQYTISLRAAADANSVPL